MVISHDELDAAIRRLWRAALARAVMDALGLNLCLNDTGAGRESAIYGARAFLATSTPHRNSVLEAAGFCPAWWQTDAVPRLRQLWRQADAGTLPQELRRSRRFLARQARHEFAEAA